MGLMRMVRPGTRLGRVTQGLLKRVSDTYPDQFDAEPLEPEELLRHSERVFRSAPTHLHDTTLPGQYVDAGYVDSDTVLQELDALDDWELDGAEVTLFHEDDTLVYEAWVDVAYTGPDPDRAGETDSILYVGDLAYAVDEPAAHAYLDDPDGQRLGGERAADRLCAEDEVVVTDVVVPEPDTPIQRRDRTMSRDAAADYLDARRAGDTFFDDAPAETIRYHDDAVSYRIVAETANSLTAFRPTPD